MTSLNVTDGNLSTLMKDGISDELYQLLWSKDELNYGPSVNIPDTIIYKFGQPVVWYFTSVNGKVKKKNKHNLISAKIEEVFNKHVLGYDVLAMFISMPSESDQAASSTDTTIEYFDRDALNNFLYNRKTEVNGILQRFIEPKTVRNEVVRAIWSPKVCLLERAENIHQLHDHRYGLYERCVIYEGPEYYFTSAPLRGPVLSGQLQKICETVVSHISEVTFGQKQISRIVLNFKVDSRDKVWLLYSTSIRCIDMLEYTSPANAALTNQRHLLNIESVVNLSNTVHLNPQKSYEKIIPKKRIRCLSCAKETLEDLRHPVTYKSIIKHYDHVLHLLAEAAAAEGVTTAGGTARSKASRASTADPNAPADPAVNWPPDAQIVEAAGGVGFGCLYISDVGELLSAAQIEHHVKPRKVKDLQIAPIIHSIHYKLSLKSYQKCKHDPLFLYKTVQVCEACYLVYAEFTTMLLQLGQDLTKLLTPDPRASQMLQRSSLDRPSSAEWRSVSLAAKQTTIGRSSSMGALEGKNPAFRPGHLRPSANHRHAKESAIGIRSNETIKQPSMPNSINSPGRGGELRGDESLYGPSGEVLPGGVMFADSQTLDTRSVQAKKRQLKDHQQQQQQQQQQPRSPKTQFSGSSASSHTSSPRKGGTALEMGSQQSVSGSSTLLYDPEEVKRSVADRERHFFKEVSLNPNLKDQHPLMHLISAQEKMKLVDEQSGVLMSKTASKSESVFGTKYGKQAGDRYARHAAYRVENPYTIHGEVILPSKLRERVKEETLQKKMNKQRSLQALLNPDSADDADDATTGVKSAKSAKSAQSSKASSIKDDPNVKSSVRHREYLASSLKRLDKDVDDAEDYRGTYTGQFDDHSSTRSGPSRAKLSRNNSMGSSIASKRSHGSTASPPLSVSKPTGAAAGSRKGAKALEADDEDADDEAEKGNEPVRSGGESLTTSLASLGEPSTESALMRKWGLENMVDNATPNSAAEKKLIKREASSLKEELIGEEMRRKEKAAMNAAMQDALALSSGAEDNGGPGGLSESEASLGSRGRPRRGMVVQPVSQEEIAAEPSPLPSARNATTPRTPKPKIPSGSFSGGSSLGESASGRFKKSGRYSPSKSIESLQSVDELPNSHTTEAAAEAAATAVTAAPVADNSNGDNVLRPPQAQEKAASENEVRPSATSPTRSQTPRAMKPGASFRSAVERDASQEVSSGQFSDQMTAVASAASAAAAELSTIASDEHDDGNTLASTESEHRQQQQQQQAPVDQTQAKAQTQAGSAAAAADGNNNPTSSSSSGKPKFTDKDSMAATNKANEATDNTISDIFADLAAAASGSADQQQLENEDAAAGIFIDNAEETEEDGGVGGSGSGGDESDNASARLSEAKSHNTPTRTGDGKPKSAPAKRPTTPQADNDEDEPTKAQQRPRTGELNQTTKDFTRQFVAVNMSNNIVGDLVRRSSAKVLSRSTSPAPSPGTSTRTHDF